MRMNPTVCSFRVQPGKFLGFMLTNKGIEENLDKCQVFIDMKSPTNIREVQQLTGRLTTLSLFLSCTGDTISFVLHPLKMKEKFKGHGNSKRCSQE